MITGWFSQHVRWSEGSQLDLIFRMPQRFRPLVLGFRDPKGSIDCWATRTNQSDYPASSWYSCFSIAKQAQAWSSNSYHKRRGGSETTLCLRYYLNVSGEVWIRRTLISEQQYSSLRFFPASRWLASASKAHRFGSCSVPAYFSVDSVSASFLHPN